MPDYLTTLAERVPEHWVCYRNRAGKFIERASDDTIPYGTGEVDLTLRTYAAGLRDAVRQRDELQRRLDKREKAIDEREKAIADGMASIDGFRKWIQRNEDRWEEAVLFMNLVSSAVFNMGRGNWPRGKRTHYAKQTLNRLRSLVEDDAQKEQT